MEDFFTINYKDYHTKVVSPIVVIDDDPDEQFLLAEIFEDISLRNNIIYFSTCDDAYEYLLTTNETPLLILSDINIPKISGLEFRDILKEHKELKYIPYIFFTSSTSPIHIKSAYSDHMHGYFYKPTELANLRSLIKLIITYWNECVALPSTRD